MVFVVYNRRQKSMINSLFNIDSNRAFVVENAIRP